MKVPFTQEPERPANENDESVKMDALAGLDSVGKIADQVKKLGRRRLAKGKE